LPGVGVGVGVEAGVLGVVWAGVLGVVGAGVLGVVGEVVREVVRGVVLGVVGEVVRGVVWARPLEVDSHSTSKMAAVAGVDSRWLGVSIAEEQGPQSVENEKWL